MEDWFLKHEKIALLTSLLTLIAAREEWIVEWRVLLAELLAQTDRLRIVATFNGILLKSSTFALFAGNEISKSAAALGGTYEGNELQLAVWTLLSLLVRRNDDRNEWLVDDRFNTEGSLGDLEINCL